MNRNSFSIIDRLENCNDNFEIMSTIMLMMLFNIRLSEEDENRLKEICKNKFPTE